MNQITLFGKIINQPQQNTIRIQLENKETLKIILPESLKENINNLILLEGFIKEDQAGIIRIYAQRYKIIKMDTPF